MSALEELRDFCEAHGLDWTEQVAQRFATYVELLEQFNRKMNLIGPMDRQQIVRSLLIDSVAAAVASPPFGSALDVGTGAGLPAIPLKILFPSVRFTLVEPRQKRATFLRIASKRLGLSDIAIEATRIEDLELLAHDWVVSKAFRAPTQWLETAYPLTAPAGHIVCLHASDATEDLRNSAAELEVEEVEHIEDVAADLETVVPPARSITVFRRPDTLAVL